MASSEIQLWQPSTNLLPEQKAQKSRSVLQCATSPRDALEAAKQLIGQWPHAKPADPEIYAASIAAVLAGYPLGLVRECVDPRLGLARTREFPPTVAAVVGWCDARFEHHRKLAAWQRSAPPAPVPEFSDEHRKTMLERMQQLMRDMLDGKRMVRRVTE